VKEAPAVETEEAPTTTVEPVAEESSETDTGRRLRRRSSETAPESSTEE